MNRSTPLAKRIRSYRDLDVWQRGIDVVVACYKLTKRFPKDELYGLVSQIRRSAVSIPANIAEGSGRDHTGDYVRHLSFAMGSLAELETHIVIARRLQYLSGAKSQVLLRSTDELGRMLRGLTKKLKAKHR